jgi:hypothetical protein
MTKIEFTEQTYKEFKGQNVFFQENGQIIDNLTHFPTLNSKFKYFGVVDGDARWYDKNGRCMNDYTNHGEFNIHIRLKLTMKDIAEHFKQFSPEEIHDIKTYLNG